MDITLIKREAKMKLGSNITADTWVKLSLISTLMTFFYSVLFRTIIMIVAPSLSLILSGILWVVFIPMNFSFFKVFLDVSRNKKNFSIKDLFHYYSIRLDKMFSTSILKSIYLFFWGIIPIVGAVKRYSYAMTEYLKLDSNDYDANGYITKSREIMNGHKMELFILDLSFIGWTLLTIITFGAIFGYVSAYLSTSRAVFYQKISGNYVSANEVYESSNDFKRANSFEIIISFVIPALIIVVATYLMVYNMDPEIINSMKAGVNL